MKRPILCLALFVAAPALAQTPRPIPFPPPAEEDEIPIDSDDVDGFDTSNKIRIMLGLISNSYSKAGQYGVEGIRSITSTARGSSRSSWGGGGTADVAQRPGYTSLLARSPELVALASGRLPTNCARLCPSTCSIEKNGCPWSSPQSWIVTMFGC